MKPYRLLFYQVIIATVRYLCHNVDIPLIELKDIHGVKYILLQNTAIQKLSEIQLFVQDLCCWILMSPMSTFIQQTLQIANHTVNTQIISHSL